MQPVPSATGAPLDQIIVVATFTTVVYAAVAWIVLRERTGHPTLLGRAAGVVAERTGLPRWFALPQLITVAGIISGVVGLYWDVSYHLANGRDEGPLANPSHYFIFIGLVAIFGGAALGAGLATDDLPRRTARVTRTWRSPYGPLITMAVGMIALLGFPLDDLWHRLFGQDVTEWGPTHLLMIGGTVMSCLGILVACAEARQVTRRSSLLVNGLYDIAMVILLCGPAALLLEFAFGVPQFPLLSDPLIQACAAGLGFVFASFRGARTVLLLGVSYVAIQFLLAALNVLAFDALMPWPPLLLGGAVVGALLARFARPTVGYGAAAGALIGVGSLAVDAVWTNAVRPTAWPLEMLPQAFAVGIVAGATTGVMAVWLHRGLSQIADVEVTTSSVATPALGRWAALALVACVAAFVVVVPPHGDADVSVDVTPVDATATETALRIEVDPDAVEDAWWFETLSWQGGSAIHGDLREVSPGVYETTRRVPVGGTWKTLIRLHLPNDTLVAAPVYLPADEAIPAPEYPLAAGQRDFVPEAKILRREERTDVPTWLWSTAYAVVGLLFAGLFVAVGAGVTAASRARSAKTASDLVGAGR